MGLRLSFKIIFSPSKEMRNENILKNSENVFEDIIFEKKTLEILEKLKTYSENEISKIMKIKNSLLRNTFKNIQNYERLDSMPAISLYNGVAFKELDISNYTKEEFDFIEDNLFFGI